MIGKQRRPWWSVALSDISSGSSLSSKSECYVSNILPVGVYLAFGLKYLNVFVACLVAGQSRPLICTLSIFPLLTVPYSQPQDDFSP